jgi:hypothetical protein
MAFILTLVAFAVICAFAAWFWKHLQLRRALSGINQPRSCPIIGHGLIVKPDADGFMNQVSLKTLLICVFLDYGNGYALSEFSTHRCFVEFLLSYYYGVRSVDCRAHFDEQFAFEQGILIQNAYSVAR